LCHNGGILGFHFAFGPAAHDSLDLFLNGRRGSYFGLYSARDRPGYIRTRGRDLEHWRRYRLHGWGSWWRLRSRFGQFLRGLRRRHSPNRFLAMPGKFKLVLHLVAEICRDAFVRH
jgi:hypothetical protein